MRIALLALCASLTLAGCQADAERRDAADDGYCRRQVATTNDARPSAYQECRERMMAYHMQGAVAASGR